MKFTKRKKIIFITILLLVGSIIFPHQIIKNYARDKTFNNTNEIKHNKVGLLLGTSKLVADGRLNLFFVYRVNAAVALFKSGKIDYILVSGDNSSKDNDEPTDFKNELIKKGVPANKIFLDYAGFRTLDSIVRAKEIFGQTEITIISQRFHNERAIYLAKKNGIDAIAYNATDVSGRYGIKVILREYLARTKVFVDLLFGVQPKFLGPQIEIN